MCELLLACVALRFRWVCHAVVQGWWGTFISVQCVPATGSLPCTSFVQAPVCWTNRFGWFRFYCPIGIVMNLLWKQLSATDVSARTLMKGTAKCDKHCELQNSVNQQGFERILRFRDIPESMPASASFTRSYFRLFLRCFCAAALRLMHSVDIFHFAATMLLSVPCVCFCVACSSGSILLDS